MPTITFQVLRNRYEAYRQALFILGASHQTVAARKAAIDVRDEFEQDIRDGILDDLFREAENYL